MTEKYVVIRRCKWYGSVRILRDDSVRLSPWSFPDHTYISVKDTSDCLSVFHGGVESLFIFLKRRRVLSACFLFTLKPDQLRRAVEALRKVRGGLERWIVPALQWNQGIATVRDEHPETYRIIPELLEECRDLPVAESWQRRCRETRREWAEHLREHPEDITQIVAPYLIPEGFTLPEPSKKARKAAKTPRRPSRK